LSAKRTLFTRIANFFATLYPLRSRKTAQLAIFALAQGALSTQLLARIELRLRLRFELRLSLRLYAGPCLGLRLQIWPSLRPGLCLLLTQRPLRLPYLTLLLLTQLALLLLTYLALLHAAINDRWRLIVRDGRALRRDLRCYACGRRRTRRRDMRRWCRTGRRRRCDVRRWRGASRRCDVRRGGRWPGGRRRRRSPRRGASLLTFILFRSNNYGHGGGERRSKH
jgi:hypothetical protein